MSSSETTVDHDRIREWAESRGGRPSLVRTEGGKGKRKTGGVLRFDFGPKEEALEETNWEEFFEVFDQSGLALIIQDKTADGHTSRFSKFVKRTGDETAPAKKAAAQPRKASGKSAAPSRDGREPTKADLMRMAREKNVPGRSRMSKDELQKAVG